MTTARISFVGDLMVHARQADAALNKSTGEYNFFDSFKYVNKYFDDSDLVVGNLETTFAGDFNDYPLFSAPDAFADALRDAGFGLLSIANNHALDMRYEGLARTIDILEERGIRQTGAYRSMAERETASIHDINGIRFAFLAYTYGVNNAPTSNDRAYGVNLLDEGAITRGITEAKEQSADFVIILAHMGTEYATEPSAEAAYWARFMLDCGADAVIACHPHIVQRIEVTGDGKLVAYSTGNFISSQRAPRTDSGVILNVTFEKSDAGSARIKQVAFVPTWVSLTDDRGARSVRVLPVGDALADYTNGNALNLRQRDIEKLRAVNADITQTILGAPARVVKNEYVLYEVGE